MGTYKPDTASYAVCDVTKSESIAGAYKKACLEFGGVDIVVHSAGLAISKPLDETTEKDWDILQNVLVKGQFELAKQAVANAIRRLADAGPSPRQGSLASAILTDKSRVRPDVIERLELIVGDYFAERD